MIGDAAVSQAMAEAFDKIVDHRLLIRRIGVNADKTSTDNGVFQLDLFTDYEMVERERALQRAMLEVRRRYGMNSVVKGMNLMKGATTIERNTQIGGHRAGSTLPTLKGMKQAEAPWTMAGSERRPYGRIEIV